MPHLETAHDVVKHLVTTQVKASDITFGDVLIAQNRIVLVSRIQYIEYGPLKFIEFEKETCPHDGEYERSIACKPDDMVQIIARNGVSSYIKKV